jgi:hypothetical protein
VDKSADKRNILVVGAGAFGRRALEALGTRVRAVADKDPGEDLAGLGWEVWSLDGAAAVERALAQGDQVKWIVPAVPVHLAAEWLKLSLKEYDFKPVAVEESMLPPVAWKMAGGAGLWYLSLADFRCPPDCPEPAEICTSSGLPRGLPMYQRITRQAWPGWECRVLRSHQLAPGVGAVKPSDLAELRRDLQGRVGQWVLATSCKCHAVLEGLENIPVSC